MGSLPHRHLTTTAARPAKRIAARRTTRIAVPLTATALATLLLLSGCGGASVASSSDAIGGSGGERSNAPIIAVGAENEYANVISQVGGSYVKVTAIMSNPSTDPHSFEASASIAQTVQAANLVVQNGLGYDGFMEKIESASPSSARTVIDVQKLLHLPDSTANPHLWYKPETMPALARALVKELSKLQPAHASYFKANAAKFEESLRPWLTAIKQFGAHHPDAAVATTEPIADYMLKAAGLENLTPLHMQADIMNGTDPSPQDITLQDDLLSSHKVQAFVYNRQVTDSITEQFLAEARKADIPVVGVYETMAPGHTYQSWMLAEIRALERAISSDPSTRTLAGGS